MAARCPTCDREGCAVAAAAQALDAAQVPVTPRENGCSCYGEFSRDHNPTRGCAIHGDREYQTRCLDLSLAWRAATADCHGHAVDWRARYFAAEPDSARWRKVAPLIERLRSARYGCTTDGEHDAVTAIVILEDHATQEPTP
jgi:hypothetical protein